MWPDFKYFLSWKVWIIWFWATRIPFFKLAEHCEICSSNVLEKNNCGKCSGAKNENSSSWSILVPECITPSLFANRMSIHFINFCIHHLEVSFLEVVVLILTLEPRKRMFMLLAVSFFQTRILNENYQNKCILMLDTSSKSFKNSFKIGAFL